MDSNDNVYKTVLEGEFGNSIYSKGGSSSGEVSYYLYIGLNRPTSATDPDSDLMINNTPIHEGYVAMGWRNLGSDISIYNSGNEAFKGGRETVCVNGNYDNTLTYVAIPIEMHIYDGLGNNLTNNFELDQENITIKGHQYNVYKAIIDGEFVLNIY